MRVSGNKTASRWLTVVLRQSLHFSPMLAAFAATALLANAQAYPVYPAFNVGGQTSLLTGNSPALVYMPELGKTFMAYRDNSSGDLFVSSSTTGAEASWSSPVNTGLSLLNGAIAGVDLHGTIYLVAYGTSTGFASMTSSNGTSWSAPHELGLQCANGEPVSGTYRPGLALFNSALYLSVTCPSDEADPFDAAVAKSTNNGASFSTAVLLDSTVSGTSLTVFTPVGYPTPSLYAGFDSPEASYFESCVMETNGSWGCAVDTTKAFASDPALIVLSPPGNTSPALYVFGEAYNSSNLTAIAAYDFVNPAGPWEPYHEYGETLTNSPAVSLAPNGTFLIAFHSNFSSHIWTYTAPN